MAKSSKSIFMDPKQTTFKKLIWANIIIWPLLLIFNVFSESPKAPVDTNKNDAQAAEISAYMKDNFAVPGYTASWYIEIDDIRINQTDEHRYIEVMTVLDRTEHPIAKNLCGAVSNYWNNHKNDFNGLRILGIGEAIISSRYSLSGYCL
ncbi:MAG: hypothetical protein V7682_07625 [Cycloclasticus sp.]